MREKYTHLLLKLNVIVWSDGCAAQFCLPYVFFLLSKFEASINLTCLYNEQHLGKGPMNGIGGTLKNAVYHDVKSGKAIINDANEFAQYVDKTIKGILSLYMSTDNVIVGQEEIKTAPKIPEICKIHKFVRFMEKGKDPSFHFYYLASDDDPFHVQSYPSPSLLECKHMIQEIINEYFCISCRSRYNNTDRSNWLKCAVYKQCFHENCF